MDIDILCEVDFPANECEAIAEVASRLGMTTQEVVRSAVKLYSAECVPTHGKKCAA